MVAISLFRLLLWHHRQVVDWNFLRIRPIKRQNYWIQCVYTRKRLSSNSNFLKIYCEKKKLLTWTIRSFESRYDVSSPQIFIILNGIRFWINKVFFFFEKITVAKKHQLYNKRDNLFLLSNNVATSRCQVHWITTMTERIVLDLYQAHS